MNAAAREETCATFTCPSPRLLAPSEVPKGVGLIEYNKHKWSCEQDDAHPDRPYKINGLRVLKHPTYRELPRFQVDGAISQLAQKTLQQARQRGHSKALHCSKKGRGEGVPQIFYS